MPDVSSQEVSNWGGMSTHGRICFNGRKVNLSHVFAGQNFGVTQVGERTWLVTFMQYDLGDFDDETFRLEPIDNPFGAKVTVPMTTLFTRSRPQALTYERAPGPRGDGRQDGLQAPATVRR